MPAVCSSKPAAHRVLGAMAVQELAHGEVAGHHLYLQVRTFWECISQTSSVSAALHAGSSSCAMHGLHAASKH
jgi:hypothetical protein